MTDIPSNQRCAECGMPLLKTDEYHPYAACAMYRQWGDSHAVHVNLKAILDHGRATQVETPAPMYVEETHLHVHSPDCRAAGCIAVVPAVKSTTEPQS